MEMTAVETTPLQLTGDSRIAELEDNRKFFFFKKPTNSICVIVPALYNHHIYYITQPPFKMDMEIRIMRKI
jgi:hypothetical protein